MDDSMDFVPCGGGMLNNTPSVAVTQTHLPAGLAAGGSIGDSTEFADGQATDFVDGLHSAHVLSNLERFRNHNFMCDVEIEVEGNVFPAHRYVLAAAIPYFNSMFASDMRESRQQRISIQDIPANAFQQLLEFAYTSRVNINGDNVQQLLYAASILQMDTVCSACQGFLTQYLTTANCLSIRQFAEQHNCVTLLSSVDDFAMEHFPELRKLPEFLMIPFGHLMDLLRSADLKVNNEQEVFETAMEWVQKAEHERKVHLPELLANVRLPQLPIAYFLNTVKKHPLIMENVRCRDLIADAMSEMMRAQLTPTMNAVDTTYTSHNSFTSTCLVAGASGGGFVPTALFSQGTFTSTSGCSSQSARSNSACCTSSNIWTNCRPRKSAAGVIFCVGGRGTSGDPFRSVEAYDWRRNRWLSIGDMNVRRRHVGVVSAQGKLYAIGGHDGTNHLDSAECFDPATNMWHTVASMDTRRRGIAVGALEGAIYAVGGLDDTACFQGTIIRQTLYVAEVASVGHSEGQRVSFEPKKSIFQVILRITGTSVQTSQEGFCVSSCLVSRKDKLLGEYKTVERYDIESDKWSPVASMNIQRGGVGVAALGKYLFAVGGNDGTSSLDSCERYDPLLNKWKMIASMQHRRAGAGVTVLDGCLYAIGGFDDNAPLPSCERYNPEENTWTLLSQMSCPRGGVGVAAMGGRIYAIGGHDGVRYLSSVEAYEPFTNQWSPVATISQCRAGAGVAWADCRVDPLLRPPSMAMGKDSGCAPCVTGVAHCV